MKRSLYRIILLVMVLSLSLSLPVAGGRTTVVQAADGDITFGIVHTNDFHGALDENTSSKYPGAGREATTIKALKQKWGTNMLLLNAGDDMQGSLLSNIKKGVPTIAYLKSMGFNAATFGNHEFDWGQDVLGQRIDQAADTSNPALAGFPFVTANIVKKAADGTCGWDAPIFGTSTTPVNPFTVLTVGTAPNAVKVGVIGVTTQEVPNITLASATAGLCFKDPKDAIEHYYDTLKSQSDIIVVLSHLGLEDGGYGYGLPVYGDKTLATKLITDGKPVDIIVGGHSHTNMTAMATVTVATVPGKTTYIAQARSSSRNVGEFTITYNTVSKALTVGWVTHVINMTDAQDPATMTLIDSFKDQAYRDLIGTEIGWSQVNLPQNYNGDNLGGDFIDDSIYNYLNSDVDGQGNPITTNDVDMFFNNAGGLRADINCTVTTDNDCSVSATNPPLLNKPFMITYGDMFNVLPFGNATVVGTMTGAQILQVLNQSATLSKGAIQPAGIHYKFFRYLDGTYTYAWGAYDACVINKETKACDPLVLDKVYKVGTNEFLAPAGGDSYAGFKYMQNVTYWGDMLNAVNAYVKATYTATSPYKGPDGATGALDGRITRNGTDTFNSTLAGAIVPVTILHDNDMHGNLVPGSKNPGFDQLATLIKQERAHNPTRTLLLNGGDDIQGDSMAAYFKTAPLGYGADGTDLTNPALNLPKDANGKVLNPIIAAMNSLNFDAMVLGNHEFNFGGTIFGAVLGQTKFPVLGANVTDDGKYGLAAANEGKGVQKSIVKDVDGIKIAIVGITNHRVPNYELPSNIPGLTFSNPITTAQTEVTAVQGSADAVVALTHIGFTTNPKSVEVDENVDTNLAAQVGGISAIIGAHSHTDPTAPETPYKFLPTIVKAPDGKPVIINQAKNANAFLGEVILGMRQKEDKSGYEVVTQAGQDIAVDKANTAEDQATKDLVAPYTAVLAAYNATTLGTTTEPIDSLSGFTQETNGANLQADAAIYELAKNKITDVDFHLSGAMSNTKVADTATPAAPYTLKVSDMYAAMPYENSLIVLSMNGPQLKAVLERAYRNYYYYKYVSGWGGYSHYPTCMIDTNSGAQITYKDQSPALPNGNNVVSFTFTDKDGVKHAVDFTDATKFYNVSTVNYLAAGSCNFNDGGKTLWPLDQTVHDTQYYVRDAVIDYVRFKQTVSPKIEGRLLFFTQYLLGVRVGQ